MCHTIHVHLLILLLEYHSLNNDHMEEYYIHQYWYIPNAKLLDALISIIAPNSCNILT